jgi:hypothetical protein
MPKFNVLYLVEYDTRDMNDTDNRIVILYDDYEETFFYYGTRQRENDNSQNKENYINYSGFCKAWDVTTLLEFLRLLLNDMKSFITSESHVIELDDSEYADLDFTKLREKLTTYNCLYAYDKQIETVRSLKQKIDSIGMKINM